MKTNIEECNVDLRSVVINYETMNATVAEFVMNQMSKNTQIIPEVADYQFISYGLTSRNKTDGSFVCPLGDMQCDANIIHVKITGLAFEYNHNSFQFLGMCFALSRKFGLNYRLYYLHFQ